MWCARFVLSVCSLVMTRENLCARVLNERLFVRLSFVVKLFIFCLKFSCRISRRISNSYFEVVFSFRCFIRLLEFRFFDSSFECRVQVPWIFVSNFSSYFRFVALFDFSNFVALFDFSNFDFSISISNSSTSISRVRISRRNSRFVALFDFSNLDSKLPSKFWFEIAVEISIRNCRRNFDLKVQFSIATINWRLSSILARTLTLRSRCHSSAARAFRA